MPVSIDTPEYSPHRGRIQDVRVYVAANQQLDGEGWRVYDAPEWELRPELKPTAIALTSGATPSSADLVYMASDAGPLHSPGTLFETLGLDAQGNVGGIVAEPAACRVTDQVKICFAPTAASPTGEDEPTEPEETVVFLGLVTKVRPDWASDTVTVHCEDYRWLMQGAPVLGGTFYHSPTETFGFLLEHLPVFNRGGKKDRYAEVESLHAFVAEGLVTEAANADWWYRGHVWNWLRHHFNTGVPGDLVSTAHYLDWPELAPDGLGAALFAGSASVTANKNTWPNLALGGQYLDKALAQLVAAASGADNDVGEAALVEAPVRLPVHMDEVGLGDLLGDELDLTAFQTGDGDHGP